MRHILEDSLRMDQKEVLFAPMVFSVLVLLSFAATAQAQLVLQPGTMQQNIVLQEVIVNQNPVVCPSTPQTEAFVACGKVVLSPPGDNRFQFSSGASFCGLQKKLEGECSVVGSQTGFARGSFYVDFCVPESGKDNCAGEPTEPASDVTTTISFDLLRIGRLVTLLNGSATFQATAQVTDLVDGRVVGFQEIGRESIGGGVGKFKTIFKVPVPIPEVDSEEVVKKTVFTVQVRRGHTHRFQIFAAGRADSGLGTAIVNFTDPPVSPLFDGQIKAENVTIDVSPSVVDILQDLLSRVKALEDRIADQAEQSAALADGLQEQIEGVQSGLGDLSARFDGHTHNCVVKPGSGPSGNARDGFTLVCGPPVPSTPEAP